MEVSGQLHAPADLTAAKQGPVPVVEEDGFAPEPVWTVWRRDTLLSLPENKPRILVRATRSIATIPTELSHRTDRIFFPKLAHLWLVNFSNKKAMSLDT
jgi:hypothetical protein